MKKMMLMKIDQRDLDGIREIYTPCDRHSVDLSRQFKYGDELVASADPSDIRNLKHLRKYWTLVKLVFDNLPEHLDFKSKEHLHSELKIQCGYFDLYKSIGGKDYYAPRSIAIDKMSQSEFNEFYDKALEVIYKFILPQVDKDEFEAQLAWYA